MYTYQRLGFYPRIDLIILPLLSKVLVELPISILGLYGTDTLGVCNWPLLNIELYLVLRLYKALIEKTWAYKDQLDH